MAPKITPEQSVRMDRFVEGLEGRTREIATACLRIPNTPDCQPEVLALHFKYGPDAREVRENIESLRQKLGLHYDALQPELQKRLYN